MIEPLGYTVLIRPEEVETKSDGGVIMVIESKVPMMERASICGKVVAIGPMAWMRDELGNKAWCEVGDSILFAKYAGSMVTDPATGEHFILLADEDIRCRYCRSEAKASDLKVVNHG